MLLILVGLTIPPRIVIRKVMSGSRTYLLWILYTPENEFNLLMLAEA